MYDYYSPVTGIEIIDPNTDWVSDEAIREKGHDKYFSNLIKEYDPNSFSTTYLAMRGNKNKIVPPIIVHFQNFSITYGTGIENTRLASEVMKQYGKSIGHLHESITELYNHVGLLIQERYFSIDDWTPPQNTIFFRSIDRGFNYLKYKSGYEEDYMKTSIYVKENNALNNIVIFTNNLFDFIKDRNNENLCYKASLLLFD